MKKLKYICIEVILSNNIDYSGLNIDCKDRINDIIEFRDSSDNRIKKVRRTIKNQDTELLNYILNITPQYYLYYVVFNSSTSDDDIYNLIIYLTSNEELDNRIKYNLYMVLSYETIYRNNEKLINTYISLVPNGKLKLFKESLLLRTVSGNDQISKYAMSQSSSLLNIINIDNELITNCFIESLLYYKNTNDNTNEIIIGRRCAAIHNLKNIIDFMLKNYYEKINFKVLLNKPYDKNIKNYILLLQNEYSKSDKPNILPNIEIVEKQNKN
jgi:hypothetical protein